MKNAIHKSTLVDIGVILYIKVLWWILGLLGVISCRACSRERLPDGHIGNAATLKIFCFLLFYFANIAEAAVQSFEFHLHADNFSQCQRECRVILLSSSGLYGFHTVWKLYYCHHLGSVDSTQCENYIIVIWRRHQQHLRGSNSDSWVSGWSRGSIQSPHYKPETPPCSSHCWEVEIAQNCELAWK